MGETNFASHLTDIMLILLWTLVATATGNDCDYKCNANGGCTVKYVGPPRAGKISGSCFPQSFGGSCSGTPRECQDCNNVLTCGAGGSQQVSQQSQSSNSNSGSIQSSDNCKYQCKADGGCGAEYVGPFRPGSKSGSCFPKSFGGGRCIGIPVECGDSCHPYCSNGQQITTSRTPTKPPQFPIRETTQRQTTRPTRQTTKATLQTANPTRQTVRPTRQTTIAPELTTITFPKNASESIISSPSIQSNTNTTENFVDNLNDLEFDIETIRKSPLNNVLKEDISEIKIFVENILDLDEDISIKEKEIFKNITDATKELFYFHQIVEKKILIDSKAKNAPPEKFITDSSPIEKGCDLDDQECFLKKFPWIRIARSADKRRFRRQDKKSENTQDTTLLNNIRNGQLAIDEADDSALRIKSLLAEYKQGLIRR